MHTEPDSLVTDFVAGASIPNPVTQNFFPRCQAGRGAAESEYDYIVVGVYKLLSRQSNCTLYYSMYQLTHTRTECKPCRYALI